MKNVLKYKPKNNVIEGISKYESETEKELNLKAKENQKTNDRVKVKITSKLFQSALIWKNKKRKLENPPEDQND